MRTFRHLLLLTTALTAFAIAPAAAGPNGPNVVGGSATVSNPGTANVTVTQQSDRAIINWHMFDVGPNERVQFVQPNSSSITLNRVIGGLGPSMIYGTIDANGRVFIINRDGILFGANSVVNTSGFLATTHDIRNEDFMAGRFNFNIPGRPDASIVNLGTINANNGGFAALVAPGVRNSGTITATLGTVTLASGNGFSLDFYGDKLVTLNVGDEIAASVKDVATGLPLKSLVTNDGRIKADGGRVELTAAAARQVVDSVINTTGVIEANTIGTKNGMIVLGAATEKTKPAGAPTQTVKISGTLKAAGIKQNATTRGGKQTPTATGGTVIVTGENIVVAGAKIDVSGPNGGGKVMIGGDWGGGKPDTSLVSNPSAMLEKYLLPTATTVSVDAATVIDASAKVTGNGGKVIIWSDQYTSYSGTILALGGKRFGDGGFAEVSSKGVLNFAGVADLRAPNGKIGTLLLDPEDYTIWDGSGPTPAGSHMTATALQDLLATTNVTIATNNSINPAEQHGDIFVTASIAWNANTTLTLSAYHDIVFYGGVTISNGTLAIPAAGSLILRADNTGTGSGTVYLAYEGISLDWSNSTGKVSIYYNPVAPEVCPSECAPLGKYQTNPFFDQSFVGNPNQANQLTAYMLVNNLTDLQLIATNLSGNYALGRDISGKIVDGPSITSTPTDPIGSISSPFNGKFDGLGNTISYLSITAPNGDANSLGLFAAIGSNATIQNLKLDNITVTANGTVQFAGVLTGQNFGRIDNVTVTASTINASGSLYGVNAGGLVGQNNVEATIQNSHATVAVSVGDATGGDHENNAGGLVGFNNGTITNSSALGNILGGTFSNLGGLVGRNELKGTITDSQAHGTVTSTSSTGVVLGGLVGRNNGSVSGSTIPAADQTCTAGQTCATGAITALIGNTAGGLIGVNDGTVANVFATGNVTASGSFTTTENSTTFPSTYLGGLIGSSTSPVTNSHASGDVSATFSFILNGYAYDSNNGLPLISLGGLVGMNSAPVGNSFATGNITGVVTIDNNGAICCSYSYNTLALGGLIGQQNGSTVSTSYATGDVTSTTNVSSNNSNYLYFSAGSTGGLIGWSSGTVVDSHANGAVTVNAGFGFAGGLIGMQNGGTVTNSFATGNVSIGGDLTNQYWFGSIYAGGLIGSSVDTMVSSSHATGNVMWTVTGTTGLYGPYSGYTGGLIGSTTGGSIQDSYATGNVTMAGTPAYGHIGGLVGLTSGTTVSASYATGNVTESSPGGYDQVSGNFFHTYAGGLIGSAGYNLILVNNPETGYSVIQIYGSITNSYATGNVIAWGTVGGLVGNNEGNITSSRATGNVTNLGHSYSQTYTLTPPESDPITATYNFVPTTGGLVGMHESGTIFNSYSTGIVTGRGAIGGFAGVNYGTIASSHATGIVIGSATDNDPVPSMLGGFVGFNNGAIIYSYSSSPVTAGDGKIVGGFVGVNYGGLVQNSQATGDVTGGNNSITGGLVATNLGTIQQSYATGNVLGGNNSLVGGLVGINYGIVGYDFTGKIVQSYALGKTTGGTNSTVAALVAQNTGTIDQTYAAGLVTSQPGSITGGLIATNSSTIPSTLQALIAAANANDSTTTNTEPISFTPRPAATTNSYWDTQTTGQNTSAGGDPKTTSQLASGNLPQGYGPEVWSSTSGFYPCLNSACSPPPSPPNSVQPEPHQDPQPDTTIVSPQLVVTQQLTKDPSDNKPTDPVVTTTTTTTTTSTPGGPKPPGAPGDKPPSWFGPNAILGSGLPPLTETRFASDELVLQLRSDLTPEQIAALSQEFGLTVIASQELGLLGRTIYRFKITSGMSVRELIPLMEKKSFIAQAQPSYVFQLTQATQTPAGNEAPPKGDSAQYIVPKLRLNDVHLLATGKGVLVAVVDSTIDVNHPDLAGVIAQRFDAVGAELSPHAHGTGMAGAIASHKRLLGIAPNARLLAIQAFGVSSGGAQGTSLAIVKGLNWAVEQGAKVINMSFAGPKDPILEQAIKALRDKGVILIAAAGNAGPKSPPLFPGADPNVIAVSATDADDAVYKNANRGKYVAIAAPGVDILVPAPDGGYQLTTGTSVAAAHVSGVAALLLERNPNLKPDDVRRIITSTATKLKGLRPEEVGAGLIDPYDALLKVAPKTATIQ